MKFSLGVSYPSYVKLYTQTNHLILTKSCFFLSWNISILSIIVIKMVQIYNAHQLSI